MCFKRIGKHSISCHFFCSTLDPSLWNDFVWFLISATFWDAESLKYTSAISFALVVVFLLVVIGITVYKLAEGSIETPRLFPNVTDLTSFCNLFTAAPPVVCAYVCHFNGMEVDHPFWCVCLLLPAHYIRVRKVDCVQTLLLIFLTSTTIYSSPNRKRAWKVSANASSCENITCSLRNCVRNDRLLWVPLVRRLNYFWRALQLWLQYWHPIRLCDQRYCSSLLRLPHYTHLSDYLLSTSSKLGWPPFSLSYAFGFRQPKVCVYQRVTHCYCALGCNIYSQHMGGFPVLWSNCWNSTWIRLSCLYNSQVSGFLPIWVSIENNIFIFPCLLYCGFHITPPPFWCHRDTHGIATRTDKILSASMIILALFTNAVAIYSNAHSLYGSTSWWSFCSL